MLFMNLIGYIGYYFVWEYRNRKNVQIHKKVGAILVACNANQIKYL